MTTFSTFPRKMYKTLCLSIFAFIKSEMEVDLYNQKLNIRDVSRVTGRPKNYDLGK